MAAFRPISLRPTLTLLFVFLYLCLVHRGVFSITNYVPCKGYICVIKNRTRLLIKPKTLVIMEQDGLQDPGAIMSFTDTCGAAITDY